MPRRKYRKPNLIGMKGGIPAYARWEDMPLGHRIYYFRWDQLKLSREQVSERALRFVRRHDKIRFSATGLDLESTKDREKWVRSFSRSISRWEHLECEPNTYSTRLLCASFYPLRKDGKRLKGDRGLLIQDLVPYTKIVVREPLVLEDMPAES